jgi:hypothetical protein
VSPAVRVTTITVTAGCYVSGVQFHYSDGSQTHHGGAALGIIGSCVVTTHTVQLEPDEFLRGITGHAGKYIDHVEFVTKKRRIGPWGGNGGAPFALIGPPEYRVKRLFGRSGAFIDALGIIVEK